MDGALRCPHCGGRSWLVWSAPDLIQRCLCGLHKYLRRDIDGVTVIIAAVTPREVRLPAQNSKIYRCLLATAARWPGNNGQKEKPEQDQEIFAGLAQSESRCGSRAVFVLPFLFLILLTFQPGPGREFYSSGAGMAVVLLGTSLSLAGMVIVRRLARLPEEPRVFAVDRADRR